MKIYEFTMWTDFKNEDLFQINEYEVEEKPKSYKGKNILILKTDIDKLKGNYGMRMFRLTNDPELYISESIDYIKAKIQNLEKSLKIYQKELSEWETLKAVTSDGKVY